MKLRTKLLVGGLLPLLLGFVVEASYASVSQSRALYQGVGEKARSLGDLLASVLAPDIALKETKATYDTLAYVERDVDFSFAVVVDGDGAVITQRGSTPRGWAARRASRSTTACWSASSRFAITIACSAAWRSG
jgi:hypothetical protein